jgi:uncharacterized membrane protein
MSSRHPAATHASRWPKIGVFSAIGVMTAYVLVHNERFLIEPSNPVWQHYADIAWWLLPHGIAGACALLLAPLQFSDRLRKRYTRAHRIVGRVYVAGALILAPMGAVIQYLDEGIGQSRSFTVLALVDALLLMSTTAIAFLFAIRRRITLHRQWMTRSYAVALVFFEARFISGVLGLDTAPETVQMTVIWCCLAMALLLAEIANNFHEIGTTLVVPVRDRSVSQSEPTLALESPLPEA